VLILARPVNGMGAEMTTVEARRGDRDRFDLTV
jgi:hypothetical protein